MRQNGPDYLEDISNDIMIGIEFDLLQIYTDVGFDCIPAPAVSDMTNIFNSGSHNVWH